MSDPRARRPLEGTGGRDGAVRIWNARTLEQLLVLRGHQGYVKDLEWSPDGTVLASASGDSTIRSWDSLPLHERPARGREERGRRASTGPFGVAARRPRLRRKGYEVVKKSAPGFGRLRAAAASLLLLRNSP